MTLRIEESTDLDVIVPLNEAVQNEHQTRRPDWFKPYDALTTREGLGRMVEDGGVRFLVAYVDEAPAGYILLRERIRDASTVRFADRSLEIDQMSVEPEHRRHGVGSALVEKAREIARAESFATVRLTVWTDNTTAKAFYNAMGFTTFHETMELRV